MAKNIKNAQTTPDEQLSCCYDIVVKCPSDNTARRTVPQSYYGKFNLKKQADNDKKWGAMFALLLQFKTKNGHCNVSRNHVEQGKHLGYWVSNQRIKKRKAILEQRRVDLLEQAGLEWKMYNDWEAMFALLLEFKRNNGHCNVLQYHIEQGKRLGYWVNNQRFKKSKATLEQRRVDLLEQTGFEWRIYKK